MPSVKRPADDAAADEAKEQADEQEATNTARSEEKARDEGPLPKRPTSTLLILIRHGQSEYNKVIAETGKDPLLRDAGLTANGQTQALQAREKLRATLAGRSVPDIGLIVMSPLTRAIDTAKLVAPAELYPAARIEVWPEVREVICGADDIGTPREELQARHPELDLRQLPDSWWSIHPSHQGDKDMLENTLINEHGYASQELINCMLTGLAVSNPHDGDIDVDEGFMVKGVKK